MGQKPKSTTEEIELSQNQMKYNRVMPIRRSRSKVAVGLFWAEKWLFWPHF